MMLKDLMDRHDMDQSRLAKLTGYSCSWVSHRLALINKMDEGVSSEIRMGTLTSSHALALIKSIAYVVRSVRRISREIGISRKRVCRILASNSVLRDTTPGNPTENLKSNHWIYCPSRGSVKC